MIIMKYDGDIKVYSSHTQRTSAICNKNNCVQVTYLSECKPDTFISFNF